MVRFKLLALAPLFAAAFYFGSQSLDSTVVLAANPECSVAPPGSCFTDSTAVRSPDLPLACDEVKYSIVAHLCGSNLPSLIWVDAVRVPQAGNPVVLFSELLIQDLLDPSKYIGVTDCFDTSTFIEPTFWYIQYSGGVKSLCVTAICCDE